MLPLLRTKTSVPPVSARQIVRQRLLDQIDAGASTCALTLIVAPAGFGKTSLAAGWAGRSLLPVAWLSLHATDRSKDRFLSYFIQALQAIHPTVGQTSLALLQSTLDGALIALVNDLAEIKTPIVFILDDFYNADSPETTQILQFLLDNRPPNFHLILSTRTNPSLYLSRLRALDQVAEITSSELRFTPLEMTQFFELQLGSRLPAEAITNLEKSMEGWAVGLQLAALALARQPDSWHALTGQEHIFEYLAEEVLRRETSQVQTFLKISALFDRFCLPLCEYLYEVAPFPDPSPEGSRLKPGDLLDHIEHANLFLVHLDQVGTWFRYHTLFTDFLRQRLPAGQEQGLYQAASDWFEKNDLLDEAIHYAVHAGDFDRAANLLEVHYRDLLQRGEQTATLEWISLLPEEVFNRRPRLWLARGWASVIAFDSAQANRSIEDVEKRIQAGLADENLRREVISLRILSEIFMGKVTFTDEMFSSISDLSEQDPFLHCVFHFNFGLYNVIQGRTAQAVDAFNETLRLTEIVRNPLVTIITHVQMGETRQVRGALGLAERSFLQAIRYAGETLGENTLLLGLPLISYADLLREQNRLDEARHFAEKGIAVSQVWQPITSMDGKITLARLLAAQGSWDAAYAHLEDALLLADNSISILDDSFIAIHMARLALLQGDWQRAGRIIEAYDLECHAKSDPYYIQELTRLLLCRYALAAQEISSSTLANLLKDLANVLTDAIERQRVTPQIEARLLSAFALQAGGDSTQAAEMLSHALTLGAQCGYLRIFADEGQTLLQTLEENRSQIKAPRPYVDQILELLRKENSLKSTPVQNIQRLIPSIPTDFPALTRRELDILQLLAEGKSNQEIAAARVLTINTVKKHVANILGKLEAANRTQAVILARKSGWVL